MNRFRYNQFNYVLTCTSSIHCSCFMLFIVCIYNEMYAIESCDKSFNSGGHNLLYFSANSILSVVDS